MIKIFRYIAVEKGLTEVVRTLITECGIGVNERTTSEISAVTPLHVAVLHGQAHLIPMLIALGADVNMLDQEKHCCPLIAAIILQDEWSVQLLIEAKANANRMSREGRGPMYIAAEKDSASILRMLIEKCGIDIDAPATNEVDKGSPLHVAAMFDNASSVAVLLQMGANINLKDALGRTAEEIAKNAFSRKAYDVLRNHVHKDSLSQPQEREEVFDNNEMIYDTGDSTDSADLASQSQSQSLTYPDEYLIDDNEVVVRDEIERDDREEEEEEEEIDNRRQDMNFADQDVDVEVDGVEDVDHEFSTFISSSQSQSDGQYHICNLSKCSASRLYCTCLKLKAHR